MVSCIQIRFSKKQHSPPTAVITATRASAQVPGQYWWCRCCCTLTSWNSGIYKCVPLSCCGRDVQAMQRVNGVSSGATMSMGAWMWLEVISSGAGCCCNLSRRPGCLSVPQAPTRGKRSLCLQLHVSIPVAKGGNNQLNTPDRRRLWTVRLFTFFPIVKWKSIRPS